MATNTIPAGWEVVPSPHTPGEIIVSAPGSNPGSMTLTGKEKALPARILYALAKQMIDAQSDSESQLPIPTQIRDLLRPWVDLAERNQYNSMVLDFVKGSRKTYPVIPPKIAVPPNDVTTITGMHAALRSFFANMFQKGINEHGSFYMARSEGQTPDASVFPVRDGEIEVHPKAVGTPFEPHRPIIARYYMMLAALEQLKRLPASEAVTGYLKSSSCQLDDSPDFVEFRITAKQLVEMLSAATYLHELPGSAVESSFALDIIDWPGITSDIVATQDPLINVGPHGFYISDSIELSGNTYTMESESGSLIDLASALCHGEPFYFGVKPSDNGPYNLSEAIADNVLQRLMQRFDLTSISLEVTDGEVHITDLEHLQTDESRRSGPQSDAPNEEKVQEAWEWEEDKLRNLGVELCMAAGAFTFNSGSQWIQTDEVDSATAEQPTQ